MLFLLTPLATVHSDFLTGQGAGKCNITWSLNCLACTAILNNLAMTEDGCAFANTVMRLGSALGKGINSEAYRPA